MTSFLALPFLFPILMVLLLAYPVGGLCVTAYTAVRGYFTLRREHGDILTRSDVFQIMALEAYLVAKGNLLAYVRTLVKYTKLCLSLAVLAVSLLCVVLPFGLLGGLVGVFKPLVMMAAGSVAAGFELAGDFAVDCFDSTLNPADRWARRF